MVAVFVWQKLHSSNGPSFKLNSANRTETFLPVAYLPAIQYGQDIAGRQVSAWMPADAFINEPQFKARFSEIHKAGILAVAWHLFADGRALGSDGTSLTPGFLKSYDEAMNIATQNRVGVIWILMDRLFLARSEESDTQFPLHADLVMNPVLQDRFLTHVVDTLVQRPSSRDVLGWIIVAEPDVVEDQQLTRSGFGEVHHGDCASHERSAARPGGWHFV
jgi:hypothetical protein